MLRRRFLRQTSSENLEGPYDWCIKYTSSKRMKPFGKDIDDIIKEIKDLAGQEINISSPIWASTNEPVIITHDTYNTSTGEGVIGFKGTEPGAFAATMHCTTPEGDEVVIILGLFTVVLQTSDLEKIDYNMTKLEFPPNTFCYSIFSIPFSIQFGALQEVVFPQNLQFSPHFINIIYPTAPIVKKPFVFKKEWTAKVNNYSALDFPHNMAKFSKWVVEEGHPIYDSREDCGCIIETASNMLCVGCSDGFIPESVTGIGSSAFYQSNIENLYIPDSVAEFGQTVFYGCRQLKSLSTASIYTFIDLDGSGNIHAFTNCNLLNNIIYRGPMEDLTPYIDAIKSTLTDASATVIHCTDGDVPVK